MASPTMRASIASCLTASLLLVAVSACGKATDAGTPHPWNAILVVVDTLRADHLSAYGYSRPTSPEFDRLAAESVLFENSLSQASCTFPSANSLLTSQPAPLFWQQPGGAMGIPADVPTVAKAFELRGYTTFAVSASPIVRKRPSRYNPDGGFAHGFEEFDERCLWRDARCVVDRTNALIERAQEPFFAYLHFMDPHGPYQPPPEHRRRFALTYQGRRDFVAKGEVNVLAQGNEPGAQPVRIDASDHAYLQALYDEEIAWWDDRFGQFVRDLAAQGVLDRTVLWITSDHGEAFLEHGKSKHCNSVFQEEVHVPMLVRLPNASPLRIALPVENLDVAPSLLALLDLPPEPAFAGTNLAAVLRGEGRARSPRTATSAQGSLRALFDGRYKMIRDLADGREWLFDLARDPHEKHDLAHAEIATLVRLKGQLHDRLATAGAAESSLAGAREAAAKLRALGYLQ